MVRSSALDGAEALGMQVSTTLGSTTAGGAAVDPDASALGRLVPPEALVLSGGGSRVSFQIGALRYLYDVVGISPGIIAGTSAGAVVAAVLAQGGDGPSQRERLDSLERMLLSLASEADVASETAWLAAARRIAPEWKGVVDRHRRLTTKPARPVSASDVRARPPSGSVGEMSEWASTRTMDTMLALRAIGRTGHDVERVLASIDRAQSMFTPGPLAQQLQDPTLFRASRVAGSGVSLRIAVVGLESGQLRYVTETGRLVDRCDVLVPAVAAVDLVDAVAASCAIPVVFPPVLLAGEHYVDGGVRETLPVEVATKHLHAERCYAVIASSVGARTEPDYADEHMLSIGYRAVTALMTDELLRDEVEMARSTAGVVVIDPEVDVHGVLDVDPGLIAISMGYGYLRAADVVQGADAFQLALTRRIISLRRSIWRLEEAMHGHQAGVGLDQLAAELIACRRQLRRTVHDKAANHLPPGADRWWCRREAHSDMSSSQTGAGVHHIDGVPRQSGGTPWAVRRRTPPIPDRSLSKREVSNSTFSSTTVSRLRAPHVRL